MSCTLAALSACGPAEISSFDVYDLTRELSFAEIHSSTTVVDFSGPAVKQYLVEGWVTPGQARPFVWSAGPVAQIEFFRTSLDDLDLELSASTLGSAEVEVELELNGHLLDTIELTPELRTARVAVPARYLREGDNRLRLLNTLGAGQRWGRWHEIRFVGGREATPASKVEARDGTIFLPFGVRVDFFVDLPRRSQLHVEHLRALGGLEGRIKATFRPDGGTERLIFDGLDPAGFQADLTSRRAGLGRLSLTAIAVPGSVADGELSGLLLRGPMIRGVASEPKEREVARASTPRRYNVVMYLIDTLRADHLGCYGYDKDTSPQIDRFASESIVFESAQAQSSWTRASVASIFTGLWPQVHGTNGDSHKLPASAKTLAGYLRAAGWRTAAFSGNGNAGRGVGFASGFHHFSQMKKKGPQKVVRRSSEIGDAVHAWLDQQASEPFFLFVHTVDPHLPYAPPEAHRSRLAAFVRDPEVGSTDSVMALRGIGHTVDDTLLSELVALYDAEISANDESFGALLEQLRERGLEDRTIVILLSDHGEEFLDHGNVTHGLTLYAEMLDTPLIIRVPGQEPGRRADLAQHVDVLPTILELLGLPAPEGIQGRSLAPLLRGGELAGGARALAHLDLRGRKMTSLIDQSWKLVQARGDGYDAFPELYERDADRGEKQNMAPDRGLLARYLVSLRKREEARPAEALTPGAVDTTAKEKMWRELRALGYVE